MVLSSTQDADLEARFGHLLQPIRDLTKNWDVDIASHLEEYIAELGTISITFDGGATTLNFAEAALLIQGSACVYGRKVEYLYSLVYQVLDLLASKKKQQKQTEEGGDAENDPNGNRRHEDDEFLTLDDLKTHKNIGLRSDEGNSEEGVHVMPKTPLALVHKDDAEKGENPLLSHKGEVLGSRQDFKMNTCAVHPSGIQLLDLSHLNLLEVSFLNLVTSTPYPTRPGGAVTTDTGPPGEDPLPQPEAQAMDISLDDHDNIFDAHEPDDLPADDQGQAIEEDVGKDSQDGLRRPERTARRPMQPVPSKPIVDHWLSLDPHKANAVTEKPFKKQKTFRLPASLESEATRKRKRKQHVSESRPLLPISEFCAQAYSATSCQRLPRNPLAAPSFPEFEHLFWSEQRRRQARVREEKKWMSEQGRLDEFLADQDEEEAENDAIHLQDPDDDDDNLDLPQDLQVPDIENLAPLPDREMDNLARHTELGLTLDDAPIVSSYEELVRQHVEGYLAGAQRYAQTTDLAKRVAEWEDRILPTLEEEDRRDPFDIHLYGTRILDRVKDAQKHKSQVSKEDNPRIPFRKVVEHQPQYEVCRLFLASLQLANAYNVEIDSTGDLEAAVDTMSLKLLSTRRHFEELVDYRAPSTDQ